MRGGNLGISAPALIVSGDLDIVLPEHSVALHRLLAHAQLAILPATNHGELTSRIEMLAPMVETFLTAADAP